MRHLRDVPVVHVAAVAARRAAGAAPRPGRRRAQRVRHVLDQLVSRDYSTTYTQIR